MSSLRLALALQVMEESPFAIEAADEAAVAARLISLQVKSNHLGKIRPLASFTIFTYHNHKP